ncbi:MAG TPA: FAD-binding oxidoreductase [bacterium]|nr:FAD-binding oxidoreductase [bacterium]
MSVASDQLIDRLTSVLGTDAVITDRATLEAHAVDGLVPRAVCSPGDAPQVAAAIRVCGETGAAIAPRGGGTMTALGNVPRRTDLVISLGRLDRLIEHDDANLTATMESGMTLAHLQTHLAQRGQFLPLDPPRPERATIGGIVAASTNGARRMFYGGVRDLVIGMKMVLPGGEQVKAGGKVVKNVAGYDMCKLFVGSLGTLGIITEVTCKMTPLPERALTIVAQGGGSTAESVGAFRLIDALFASTLQPSAIAMLSPRAGKLVGPGGPGMATAVAVEGFTEAVDRHVRDITGMAAAAGLSAEALEGPAHERLWAAVADFPRSREGEALVRLTVPPGAVAAAVDALSRVDGSAVYVAHAGAGTIWIGVEAERATTVFAALTSVAGAHHGHAVLASAPPEVKRGLDVWGSPPPALSIMREIKQRFDPQQLLNPGRFVAFL